MHITPIRKDLHWLPIQERINYKIIVTVYKCIHRLAPNYLSSILTTRDNRLRQKQVCHELNTHSCAKVVGKQAFGTRAPELWNKLPLNIRTIPTLQSFKQTLKTYLFQSAYRLLWVFSLVFNKILKLLARMTFYSVSAVIGYAAGYKHLKKYNNNNNNKCWASVAGADQYLFRTSQYFMLAIPAWCFESKLGKCWAAVCDAGPHSVWRQTRHGNPILG